MGRNIKFRPTLTSAIIAIIMVMVMAALAAGAGYTAYIIKERQVALSQVSGYNVTWLVSRGAWEIARMHATVAEAMIPGSDVDTDAVVTRLDTLSNRVSVLLDGDAKEFLFTVPELKAFVLQMKYAVEKSTALMADADSSKHLPELLHIFCALNLPMSRMASATNVHGGDLVAAEQNTLDQLHWQFAYIMMSISLVAFGLAIAVMWNNVLLARAHRRSISQNMALSNQIAAREEAEESTRRKTEENIMLETRAYTDGLTGVANRRRFDEIVILRHEDAVVKNKPFSVILMDVDKFKVFNDTYGHQAGDECLQLVAKVVAHCGRRTGELAARYGGEEFVLVLPDLDEAEAVAVAEVARKGIMALEVPDGKGEGGFVKVTASFGVCARIPSGGENPKDMTSLMLKAADSALYIAKEGGRNQVRAAQATDLRAA